MSQQYVVIEALVTTVTPNVVQCTIAPKAPKTEERRVTLPKSVFRDPELVEKGDDEIEIARWLAVKEGLTA